MYPRLSLALAPIVCVALLLCITSDWANASPGQITKLALKNLEIELTELPAENAASFQISLLKTDQGTLESEVFALEHPSRLVIDLKHKANGRPKVIDLSHPPLSSLRIGYHGESTRLVIDIDEGFFPGFQVPPKSAKQALTINFNVYGSTEELSPAESLILSDEDIKKIEAEDLNDRNFDTLLEISREEASLIEKAAVAKESVKELKTQVSLVSPEQSVELAKKTPRLKVSGLTPLVPPPPVKKIKAAPPKKSTKKASRAGSKRKTKAYTFRGKKLALVEIDRKKTFTRTPKNPNAHYQTEYSAFGLRAFDHDNPDRNAKDGVFF